MPRLPPAEEDAGSEPTEWELWDAVRPCVVLGEAPATCSEDSLSSFCFVYSLTVYDLYR